MTIHTERVAVSDTPYFLVDVARYNFAKRYVRGKRVLDIASGAGWGTALLAESAESVLGVDVDQPSITEAQQRYFHVTNARFALGSCEALPAADRSIDVLVSIETFEHIPDPARFLDEIERVLTSNGLAIITTPRNETDSRFRPDNPFHIREYSTSEFADWLAPRFSVEWFSQVTEYGQAGVPDLLTGTAYPVRAARMALRWIKGSPGLTISASAVEPGILPDTAVQVAVCHERIAMTR